MIFRIHNYIYLHDTDNCVFGHLDYAGIVINNGNTQQFVQVIKYLFSSLHL